MYKLGKFREKKAGKMKETGKTTRNTTRNWQPLLLLVLIDES
jgi:hypothetical protein